MKNTLRSKTWTASVESDPSRLFQRIADPDQLASWHLPLCRSLRREQGTLWLETPRGPLSLRMVRDDRALALDLLLRFPDSTELLTAIRILSNGNGSELVMTLVQPAGLPDAAFHEHVRAADSAMRQLRKPEARLVPEPPTAAPVQPVAPPASVSDIPVSEETKSAPEEAAFGRKLFIGNLPFDWSEDLLRGLCAELGAIASVTIARFRNHGRSRGFGFVEMSTEEEARAAIEKLHGALAGGRKIVVRLSRSQENRPERSDAGTASAPPLARPAPVKRPPQPRPAHRAPAKPARAPRQAMPPRGARPSQDITNKGGYEYFPRRAPGSVAEPLPTRHEEPSGRLPTVEASPYFDDAGTSDQAPRSRRRRR